MLTILDTRPGGKFYNRLVDLKSGEIIEDISTIIAAEEQARANKYGKLREALYDKLQTIKDDETVTVMIWGGGRTRAKSGRPSEGGLRRARSQIPGSQSGYGSWRETNGCARPPVG